MAKRIVYPLIIFLAVFSLSIAAYAWFEIANGNFHEVVTGELYRSAQPKQGDIQRYAKNYGIRTVINLRGRNDGSEWYDREVRESREAGVGHLDFRLSAKKKRLSPEEALALIEMMKTAPKPLLIHCEGGANRTGLAAALYLAKLDRADEDAAEAQMSIFYGSLPHCLDAGNGTYDAFELLEPLLGYNDS